MSGHFKTHPTWKDRIGGSGLNWPLLEIVMLRIVIALNILEHISVNGNTVVTFTATHGMDWNATNKTI